MRSTLLHFSRVLSPLMVAGALTLGACGNSSESARALATGDSPAEGSSPGGGNTTVNPSDGGSGDKGAHRGLCGVVTGTCSPDEDGTYTRADGALACAPPPGGGTDDDDALGCRIAKVDGAVVPKCDDADPRGVDGVSCSKGADCAPGFDCVEGEKGAVCRRYCCAGSCASQYSQNGGPTFCDIGKLVDPSLAQHIAPVCMPIKTCKLLREDECGDKETCAVVNDKGDTGCVPTGNAKAGELCNEDHCDRGLTCLGSPGDRRCYKLCRVEGMDCAPTQTCTTGSVFQDTTFGVCK
ncbi:MAG: hypothetical protein KF850_18995 [Labilithrix sp.]|nr:hypothetical protein [Labilithrix sp.]